MSIRKSKLALAVGFAIALPTSAFATNGILQVGNGMVAHGMGGAGLANASEASSGMDNPALINQTGDSASLGWSIFMPKRSYNSSGLPGGHNVSSDSPMFAIPQGAFTAKFNDNLSWGIMAYAMGGMNTDYSTGPFPNNPQAPYDSNPQSVNLEGLIVAPTVSYAFSNNLSAGVSVIVAKETFTVRNLFGQGPGGTFEGNATGYGAKLGVDYKITNGIAVAATVQPKLSMGEIGAFKNFLGNFHFTGNAQLTVPDEYGIGGKFAVGQNVDVVADLMYYAWNGVDVYKFFGWKSEPVLKIGAEFRPTDKWALRAGIDYGKSPIQGGNSAANGTMDAAYANYSFPAISEGHITIGAGYKLDKNMTVNGYYLYAPKVTETAAATSSTPGFKVSMSQNAAGLDMNYAF